MTFTTTIKNEISKNETNRIESLIELNTYLKFNAVIKNDSISIFIENASVARRVFKLLKVIYGVTINLKIRQQKKFSITTIYILEVKEKINEIIKNINSTTYNSEEEKIAYLRGLFLATGSVNDPKTSQYHLEFLIPIKKYATITNRILKSFSFNSKIIKREKGYMVYLKSSEEISDFIKLLGATNALFYFEDIRIYRDHKNMVNRLNNCEQANLEKSIKTANDQVNKILFLKEHDLFNLLDDKTKIIMDYRIRYRENTYQELADIISMETDIKLTKSGINHHLRKVNEIYTRYINKNEEK